jgi:hypothetical protein
MQRLCGTYHHHGDGEVSCPDSSVPHWWGSLLEMIDRTNVKQSIRHLASETDTEGSITPRCRPNHDLRTHLVCTCRLAHLSRLLLSLVNGLLLGGEQGQHGTGRRPYWDGWEGKGKGSESLLLLFIFV